MMWNGAEFMGGGAMWFGGFWMILLLVLGVLSVAALIKYLMK